MSWQRCVIRVEENVEGSGRNGRFARFDFPNLTCWHDEIVSSEAVVVVEFGLEIMRCDATGRGGASAWAQGYRTDRRG